MDELIILILILLGLRKREPGPGPAEEPEDEEPEEPVFPGVVVEPEEPEEPGEPVLPGVVVEPGEPDGPVLPGVVVEPDPTDVDELIVDYPRPRAFYQVKAGDNFTGNQGIATRMARSALYLAATEIGGLDQAAANAWAAQRTTLAARRAVTDLISCTPINDWRYGTWAYTPGVARPGPHGRAIRLLPINLDDRSRLKDGNAFSRNVKLGKPGDPPSVSQKGVVPASKYELLWLPGIDLARLWQSNGLDWEVGGAWSDGSSHVHPPPALFDRGVEDFSNAGTGPWGCAPYAIEAEE